VARKLTKQQRKFWIPVIQKVVLGLSDQQIITGGAILLTAFIRLAFNRAQLSVYHLNIVSDMAWLASNTHLVTIVVLQRYFQKNFGLRVVRVTLMLLLAAGLIAVSIFTAHQYDYDYFSCPAECLIGELSSNIGGIPMRWMIVSIVFICTDYPGAIVAICDWNSWEFPSIKKFYNSRNGVLKLILKSAWFFVYDIYWSDDFSIGGLVAWFGLGMYWAISDRITGHQVIAYGIEQGGQEGQSENEWGFGQFLPMFLISLNALGAVDVIYGIEV